MIVLLEMLFTVVVEATISPILELIAEKSGRFQPSQTVSAPRTTKALQMALILFIALVLGAISIGLFPAQLLPDSLVPGGTLLLSPLLTGAVMAAFGKWRSSRGHSPTPLATFAGGAVFGFGYALSRWLFAQTFG